jgi:hypothetical protein
MPGNESTSVAVNVQVAVSVEEGNQTPQDELRVYSFDGGDTDSSGLIYLRVRYYNTMISIQHQIIRMRRSI